MIKGHGDDGYLYGHIETDFSSNICAKGCHQRLMAHLASCPQLVSHYPEPEAWSLERMIAERQGLDPQQVIVTNGATEAIYLIAQTFAYQAEVPSPTFSEYEDACNMFPRTDTEHRMVWLCNPNNPTGMVYSPEVVERMAEKYDLLVVDQSYEDYTDQIVMSAREGSHISNLIQIHSFTKSYGIPGLRLGYITAHAALTTQLRRNLRPWCVSHIAIEAGKYLLQHDELRCKPDLAEAQRLREMLGRINGIVVEVSKTNFMLCEMKTGTAAELKDYLAQNHHMLIRDASNFRGLTPRHFRIAAQLPHENDQLVAAIKEYMTKKCNS